jgi:hypothetical protein
VKGPFVQIHVVARGIPDLPLSWGSLLAGQLRGEDPTAGWRAELAAATTRSSGVPVAPTLPAAFVLQWVLEVAAEVGVDVALHHGGVVDPRMGGLTFALHPTQLYPVAAQVRVVAASAEADGDRLDAARTAYRSAGTQVAESYAPGVNLGRHQRVAMVDDVWALTLARRRGQGPPVRRSCCYLFVLPGTRECAGCPRLSR